MHYACVPLRRLYQEGFPERSILGFCKSRLSDCFIESGISGALCGLYDDG